MSCVKNLPDSTIPVYDHNNNMYSSIREMCAYYKINHSTYLCRRKRGWTQEEALTIPCSVKNNRLNQTRYCVEDHKGNKFRNLTEMCNAYGLSKRTYTRRLELGYSKQEALETPRQCGKRVATDHLGNLYESQNAMLRHYGVSKSLFESRIRRGYSLEEALTCNHNERNSSECKMLKLNGGEICDFNGKEFKSFREMCAYHHINYSLFKSRFRDRGYTLKDALTPTRKIAVKAYDHLGNEYANNKKMCEAYGVPIRLYEKRFYEYKWTIEEALTLPRNMYIGEYRVAECLKRLNVKFYHDCSIKTIFTDLELSINWTDFLTKLQSHLGSAEHNWSKRKIQRLRPDFVLYTDEDKKIRGVIEFDGEQHQNFVEFFFKTIEEFYRRSNTDFAKQSFWEYLNIPMLRIRHDQIDMIDDMVQDFIDNPQNYIHNHNTYLSENEYWSILTEQKQQIELAFAI